MSHHPFHTRPITPQRNGAYSAAANLLSGSYHATPCPDGHRLVLQDIAFDHLFQRSEKARENSAPDGPITFLTIDQGRGLVFQNDGSALAVRQSENGWDVLPAPIALVHQLFHADDDPKARTRSIKVRIKGTCTLNIVAKPGDPMAEAYEAVFFQAVDRLLSTLDTTLPLGDVRCLNPQDSTLPQHVAWKSWCNWPTPTTNDTTSMVTFLHRFSSFIMERESGRWPDMPNRIDFQAFLEPFEEGGFGRIRIAGHPRFNPLSTSTALSLGGQATPYSVSQIQQARARFQKCVTAYIQAIKPWLRTPGFDLPMVLRHPRQTVYTTTQGPKPTRSAHQRLEDIAMFQAMTHDVEWPAITVYTPS